MAVSEYTKSEAVRRMAAGDPSAQIARDLSVSEQSVRNWARAAASTTRAAMASVVPPTVDDLAPVPALSPPWHIVDDLAESACGICRPPQGVHPDATSVTCEHGHWELPEQT